MAIEKATLESWVGALRGLPVDGPWRTPGRADVVLVDLDEDGIDGALPDLHTGLAAVVVGTTERPAPEAHPRARICDVAVPVGDESVEAIAATVAANPMASSAFALLLRGAPHRSVDDGLMAESAVYSALQGGPEFARWRAGRPPRERSAEGAPVDVHRAGDELHLTLQRPAVRNALSSAMRDALVDALGLARADPSIERVHLWGEGASFCAGGDLDEFGTFPDPASAHLVRLQQSVGRHLAALADAVTAHLHGACFGSGIELPAFAGTVMAASDTVIALPETSLGLVPGAGGTVSLPRRIGRHRTALLGLTGVRIDAETALSWGLVDAIVADDGRSAAR